MPSETFTSWLEHELPKFDSLTSTVVSILENLLRAADIDFLAVTGRTKALTSIEGKIQRKNYSNPQGELTDISGIRVIVYFESDVKRVSEVIEKAFRIDKPNSLDRDALLSVDQLGYRSVHFVCDLGASRITLPEYHHLSDLRFEVQVRTVLQHAWAELAHDRNYKFSGTLPRTLERELYLYAGMLEIADKGFDKLSREIEEYARNVRERATAGDYDIELNSVSLEQFLKSWTEENHIPFEPSPNQESDRVVIQELKDFGIQTLGELRKIIPSKFPDAARTVGYSPNTLSLVRDWMIVHDLERYRDRAWKEHWYTWEDPNLDPDQALYILLLGKDRAKQLIKMFAYSGS
jgi:ppGpp synthetase/RelA/SpoT-type nucleotidyltranferase